MSRPSQLDPTVSHRSSASLEDATPRHHLLPAYRTDLFGAMPGICGGPSNLRVLWAQPVVASIESELASLSLIDELVYRPAVA